MAFAMRINFTDVIRDGSLEAIYANGNNVGYQFDIRLSYYRGHFLSVIDTLKVKTDGEEVPGENLRFCIHDREYGVSQLHDLVSEFWRITEPATLRIFKEGGIEAGEHDIEVTLMFHSPYMPIGENEYMPIDSCDHKTLTMPVY